jgi:hypothetical protein
MPSTLDQTRSNSRPTYSPPPPPPRRTQRLEPAAWSGATTAIARNARAARVAGVQGTPAFQLGRTGRPLHLVRVTSLDPAGIRPALDAALAR